MMQGGQSKARRRRRARLVAIAASTAAVACQSAVATAAYSPPPPRWPILRVCTGYGYCPGHRITRPLFSSSDSRSKRADEPLPSPLPEATSSAAARQEEGIRLNKVFRRTHSRREADGLIASGRVAVNGVPVESKGGFKVVPFRDTVTLDGRVVAGWEEMNAIHRPSSSSSSSKSSKRRSNHSSSSSSSRASEHHFEYVKYWKPRGVTCTTDRKVPSNLIDAIRYDSGYDPKHRVFPVGRLDRDTTGLILLTSDGRLPNSALRGRHKQPKVYEVHVDKPIPDQHVQRLRDGIVITTVAQRDGNRAKPLTARTLPCGVERIGNGRRGLRMTLVEGRNRQIRKMLGALGYTVTRLHRVSFMGLTLEPALRGAGDWAELDDAEMRQLRNVIRNAEIEEL